MARRAESEKEVLVFTSPSMKQDRDIAEGENIVDMVYIKVGVNLREAEKIRQELLMLIAPAAKEISEGLSVVGVKQLLKMDAHQAMRFMALMKELEISELRTPYSTHKGISLDHAKELSEKGLLHIVGLKTKTDKIRV